MAKSDEEKLQELTEAYESAEPLTKAWENAREKLVEFRSEYRRSAGRAYSPAAVAANIPTAGVEAQEDSE